MNRNFCLRLHLDQWLCSRVSRQLKKVWVFLQKKTKIGLIWLIFQSRSQLEQSLESPFTFSTIISPSQAVWCRCKLNLRIKSLVLKWFTAYLFFHQSKKEYKPHTSTSQKVFVSAWYEPWVCCLTVTAMCQYKITTNTWSVWNIELTFHLNCMWLRNWNM